MTIAENFAKILDQVINNDAFEMNIKSYKLIDTINNNTFEVAFFYKDEDGEYEEAEEEDLEELICGPYNISVGDDKYEVSISHSRLRKVKKELHTMVTIEEK